jgi:hypothetical protein
MNKQEFEELSKLIDIAIEGSLATNDEELYADAQDNIKRIDELLKRIQLQ